VSLSGILICRPTGSSSPKTRDASRRSTIAIRGPGPGSSSPAVNSRPRSIGIFSVSK
jgi:hypothetical protein